MKTIEIVTTNHTYYREVCDFANKVYEETIGASARKPPNTLFAALENGKVHGCIGLSNSVSSDIFLNDTRFWDKLESYSQSTQVAEQNIFAVKQFPAGIPLLITVTCAYAEVQGIQKIAFAGTSVFCKIVTELGFGVTILGKTEPSVLSEEDRVKYAFWLERHHPVSCILDTANATLTLEKLMKRFSNKAQLAFELKPCVAA